MAATNQKKFQPQKLSYFNDALLVHILDFPAYHIECISERHFIVAGGGGSSKTGVINQFNILELVPDGNSCRADLVTKYPIPDDVSSEAIMNGAIMRDLPIFNTRFVALGNQATIYHIKFDSQIKAFEIIDYESLRSPNFKTELKSIAYSPSRVYTGSLDGTIDVWDISLSGKKLVKKFRSHNKEVDEIDVDTINQQILTLSRGEARFILWDTSNFEPIKEFKKDFINDRNKPSTNYTYRSCRFVYNRLSHGNSSEKGSVLLIATNPLPAKSSSMLHRVSISRDGSTNKFSNSVSNDAIMAMAVSSDGKNVAIGTRSGDVMVFDTHKLNHIYRFQQAHQNNVTDLEFLPPKPESLVLSNSETCPLVSISLDRRIVLHRPKKSTFGVIIIKIIIVVALIFTFAFSNIPLIRIPAPSTVDA